MTSLNYLRKLPLLEFTSKLYNNIDLKDTYILCAQHVVSTSYSLFNSFIQLGLKPSNLSVIGKCYSTDPQAYSELLERGVDVCPTSIMFDIHTSFDIEYALNIKNSLMKGLKEYT